MSAASRLEVGRAAIAERRWRDARDVLAEADGATASGLAASDLELFATASMLCGSTGDAVAAMTRAHDTYLADADIPGAARTAGWLALQHLEMSEIALSGTWMTRGVRLVAQLGDADAIGGRVALVVAALTGFFVGDYDEARRRFGEIAAIAARTGDGELAAHADFGSGMCLTSSGMTAEGLESFDRVVAAVAAGDVSPLPTCAFFRMMLDVAHAAFDLRRAADWTDAFGRWCDAQPQLVAYSGQCHAYRAQLLCLRGRWAEASSAALLAEERLRAGDFTAAYVSNYQLAELHRLRGEFRAADPYYRKAAATGWDPQPGWSLLRLAQGDVPESRRMLRHAVAGAEEGNRRRLLPAVVEVELAAGDVATARAAADDLAELCRAEATGMLAALAAAAAARVSYETGDHLAGLDAAEDAIRAWADADVPYEAARCEVVAGRVLSALGRQEDAARRFEAARAAFDALGARADSAETAELLGIRTPGALTHREIEVLRLVSTGLTNRAVAERLSLSEKTVARHLSNIFAKLGISSRAAATAYAYETACADAPALLCTCRPELHLHNSAHPWSGSKWAFRPKRRTPRHP